MNPLPVSARGLRRRELRLRDATIREADVLPFFDRQGDVGWIAVLTRESPGVLALPHRAGLVRVPVRGPIFLDVGAEAMKPLRREDMPALVGLWHYDPWWLLDEDCYRGYWAVNPVKSTNCAGRLTKNVTMAYFRRDLSRLKWVKVREWGSSNVGRWRPGLLLATGPEASTVRQANQCRPSAWLLQPVWERQTVGEEAGSR